MKKYKAYVPVVSIIFLFCVLIIFKKDMVRLVSQNRERQLAIQVKDTLTESISRKYNYVKNGGSYDYTFLEFGSTGCHVCRQMEKVMEEVRGKYKDRVKVVFINVMEQEIRLFPEYFGIALIPTQVILDKKGYEIFRNTGYISAGDLGKQFK